MKRDLKQPMDDKKIKPTEPLISIKNLEVKFINQDATVYAVNGVDIKLEKGKVLTILGCLLYTSPSPRDLWISRMPSSA